MTATPFAIPWVNPDLDIHPDPAEGWHRVAVVCGWHDAAKARARWPHAAVVGPLRTLGGIDLLVRGLLANPQIRVLVWDGPDLNGGRVKRAVALAFGPHEDLQEIPTTLTYEQYVGVLQDVTYLDAGRRGSTPREDVLRYATEDRPGGAVILPPPPPTVSDTRAAPVTAPRFEADTLAALWPQVMGEILRAGRKIPTHYGDTLEVLNMVGVIRDPVLTLARLPAEDSDSYNFNWADLEEYTTRLTTSAKGEDMAYSYGSLLVGEPWWEACDERDREAQCRTCKALVARIEGWRSACAFCGATTPDQVAAIDQGLADDPMYRGHFATPWHPSRFTGAAAKGKPCLVGVQFRVTEDEE